MANPIYSTRIWMGNVQTTYPYPVVATVPPGHRLVVTQLNFSANAAPNVYVILYITTSTLEALRVPLPTDRTAASWEGRVVVHEHEGLALRALTNPCFTYIGGYLLEGAGGPIAGPHPLADEPTPR